MFFRKKGPPPPPPPPPEEASHDPSSSAIWSGDQNVDRRRFEALLSSNQELSQTLDLDVLLPQIVDLSVQHTGAERGFLILRDERGETQVRVARMRGHKPVQGEVRFARTVVRRVLESRESVRATVNSDSEALDLGTSVFDLKLRAVMCVPLVERDPAGKEKVDGVLYVDSKAATREFKPEDLTLFNALSQNISVALARARDHKAQIEKARQDEEMRMASEVQKGLMPAIPEDLPGYDVFGWYRPAERTTGDFYEVVQTRQGRLCVALGDATGHGIGPALITATAQAQLRAYLRMMADPGQVVTLVNQDLAPRMDDSLFLTLFLAMFGADGSLATVNAGQTPPLLWRAGTKTIETLRADGPALGMMDDFEYATGRQIQLEPGDVVLAVTDGFVEARSQTDGDKLFGEEGVRAVLEREAARGASARAMTEALVQAALEFAGGRREDDMTVVALRRRG
jgi:serine phosphatase RsbU (regulator of sigma subunit)